MMTLGLCLALAPASAQTLSPTAELDAFMAQVLTRRDENWKKVQQYILDEQERVEFRGPGEMLLWGAGANTCGTRATGFLSGARSGSTASPSASASANDTNRIS